MAGLRTALAAVLDRARADGSKVIAIDAIEQILNPRHLLHIDPGGGWEVSHPARCVADCPLAHALRTAHLLSAPYARGRTYEVWLDDTALKFLDVTP